MHLHSCMLLATKLTQTFKLSSARVVSECDLGSKTWCLSSAMTAVRAFLQCHWVITQIPLSWVWPFSEKTKRVPTLWMEQISLVLVGEAGFDPECAKKIQELFRNWLAQLCLVLPQYFLSTADFKNLLWNTWLSPHNRSLTLRSFI